MDANRIYKRAGIIRDTRAKYEWLMTITIAASCCWYPGCLRVDCDVHHIIQGVGRSDEFCNFGLLCHWRHHRQYHDGGPERLTLGQLLWLKKTLDPGNWNPSRLAQLRGQALPELTAA